LKHFVLKCATTRDTDWLFCLHPLMIDDFIDNPQDTQHTKSSQEWRQTCQATESGNKPQATHSHDEHQGSLPFGKQDVVASIKDAGALQVDIGRELAGYQCFKNSPLHDGAMIIVGDRIVAARCQLPMTARRDIPAHYGMRHRAAIGVTEDTDADVVVVSEETGNVSYVHGGEIQTIKNIEELRSILAHTLLAKEEA
ncbi:MAG: DNA integrity scanning protein DisA nucleotide-binding domain protein, partial [Selenomonadaceae bacterium]|nr:DNA integrity scanning protein DisA nucleotide-binding domain protein [Selenomonadaceae bacterium]